MPCHGGTYAWPTIADVMRVARRTDIPGGRGGAPSPPEGGGLRAAILMKADPILIR
jgi:hypothetical protein